MTFSGVFAPIPTPFADDGEIDLAAWRDNIDRWMGTGLHGLVVLGTNGEAPLVDDDEADRLIAAARGARSGGPRADRGYRSPVYAERHTRVAAGGRSRRRRGAGADAVLLQGPADDLDLHPSLHGRGRRVAGACAPLQLFRPDRGDAAGGGRRGAVDSRKHRRTQGVGPGHELCRGSGGAGAGRVQRARRLGADVLLQFGPGRTRWDPGAGLRRPGRMSAALRAGACRVATTRRANCSGT